MGANKCPILEGWRSRWLDDMYLGVPCKFFEMKKKNQIILSNETKYLSFSSNKKINK